MLSEDLADFVASGVSISLATRNADLEPEGTRGWAAIVDPDRVHVTVHVHSSWAPTILRDLEDNGRIAICFSRPRDHRTCQLKGRYVDSRPSRPGERAEVERQANGFLDDLDGLGYPRRLTSGWKFWPCVALRMRVEDVFHQTPGPGAGERMP